VRHLPRFGWQPRVITLATDDYERHDPALLDLVPAGTEIVRVPNRDPWQAFQSRRAGSARRESGRAPGQGPAVARAPRSIPGRALLRRAVRRVEALCYHPDPAVGWIRPAVAAGVEMAARLRPSVIWATGGPWSAFVAARRLSERLGVPYVLDFRDAWTLTRNEYFEAQRPRWAARLDRRMLAGLFEAARGVVLRYETEAECYVRAYPRLDPARIHLIPNGFEGAVADFDASPGMRCVVLYAGTLTLYRYDTLLEALARLDREDSERAGRLLLRFVGEDNEPLAERARQLGVSRLVETRPPVPHREVARLERAAHALLMLERTPRMKGYELLAGAKLFEYLSRGRPILGVLPYGEARNVLEQVSAPTIADVDSVPEIVSLLRRTVDAWKAGTLAALLPDGAKCAAFSAERQTAVLERALAGQRAVEAFVPGRREVPPSLRAELGPGPAAEPRTSQPRPAAIDARRAHAARPGPDR
jgi:hypothetical protein